VNGGRFISFEGVEGCGKSTQARLLAEALEQAGHAVVRTCEPGGTALGRSIRGLLLDPANEMADRVEALLYAADRAQHVEEVIRPALDAGKFVICDRFADSTIAYQGYGLGLKLGLIDQLNAIATAGRSPNLTLLLDLDPVVGQQRKRADRADRIEQRVLDFHHRVRDGFLAIAASAPQRVTVLDGTRNAHDLQQAIVSLVTSRW